MYRVCTLVVAALVIVVTFEFAVASDSGEQFKVGIVSSQGEDLLPERLVLL